MPTAASFNRLCESNSAVISIYSSTIQVAGLEQNCTGDVKLLPRLCSFGLSELEAKSGRNTYAANEARKNRFRGTATTELY